MKSYEIKTNLSDKELTQLILLVRKIRKEAKARGIEMSKRTARHHALEHLGWTGFENEIEILESASFRDGQKTADPRFQKEG